MGISGIKELPLHQPGEYRESLDVDDRTACLIKRLVRASGGSGYTRENTQETTCSSYRWRCTAGDCVRKLQDEAGDQAQGEDGARG